MHHQLLKRQLRKNGLDPETLPERESDWSSFLDSVHRAYLESDQDRSLLERSLSISSDEMRELHDQLAAQNASLESQVVSRTRDLEHALEAAEAAAAAKSEFLANASHEIRTPLNGIVGSLALLDSASLDHDQTRYLEAATSSASILQSLINDILDMSRIEAGRLDITYAPVHLEHLIDEARQMFSPLVQATGVRLRFSVDTSLPVMLVADSMRLKQVLINIVNNAVKFSPGGDVDVRVSTNGGKVRFEVADTGIGIPADRRHKLFQTFSQLDASRTRRFGGSGLGLAICAKLVALMQGEIGVDSVEHEGSTFWFTLPLRATVDDASSARAGRVPRPDVRAAGSMRFTGQMRVLLAEDNEVNRMIARETLERAGRRSPWPSTGRKHSKPFRPARSMSS